MIVFVTLATDPDTGSAEPICVNRDRSIAEAVLHEIKESLELRLCLPASFEDKARTQRTLDSLCLTKGLLILEDA